jgi:hypothetical protein
MGCVLTERMIGYSLFCGGTDVQENPRLGIWLAGSSWSARRCWRKSPTPSTDLLIGIEIG